MSSEPKTGIVETKRALREAGLQIYEVREGFITLAERVRDNLILQSGIAVSTSPFRVQVTLRAQSLHFPGQTQDQVLAHAVELAGNFVARGYREVGTTRTEVADPSHPERTLDVVHAVIVERPCDSWEEVLSEIKEAFSSARASTDSDNPPPFSVNSQS
jgi:hypothetical protein